MYVRQKIIDLTSMKYRYVHCPKCKGDQYIEINAIIEDEYGEVINEYICRECYEIFILDEENRKYEKGFSNEDQWHDLTEDMKIILGINKK